MAKHSGHTGIDDHVTFPTDIRDLPESHPCELVTLADGQRFELRIAPIVKRLGDATVRMLAYNGSVPGPTLRVQQGSEVTISVTNEADTDATVHWHGLRLENAYDGTHETQAPMQVGQSFSYRLQFPDPGLYWYHPHVREDYGQEMGLYANIVVVPSDPDYWPPVNREELLTLDDVLLEDGQIASFSRSETTYVAMGRFGNTMLVGGEVTADLSADLGEVVRFYLTNTANTRVFNVGFDRARMKLVGGDSGRFERESIRHRGDARSLGADRRRCPVRPARARDPRAPPSGAHLRPGVGHRRRDPGGTTAAHAVRRASHQRRHDGRTGSAGSVPRRWHRTRPLRSLPRWTWVCQPARSPMPVRCTPRWCARIRERAQRAA